MKIEFVDLKRQYLSIKEEIDEAMYRVVNSASFILSQEVSDFETHFAAYCNTKYCIGTSSGLDSLYLSLKALEIGPGDEVITTANTFIATALAISRCGAKPVLVDCNALDYNIDVLAIESAVTEKTKVIIPVHLYGQPADMDSLLELAQKYNLYIVEDACQAHGAEYKGKKVGSIGNVGCFSFYPTKNLGAYGDGGAITTNNSDLAEKIRLLRDYGQNKKYYSVIKGDNCRLDSIQAAILNVKLRHVDAWNEQRRNHAKLYNQLLEKANITLPYENGEVKHVYHAYTIQSGMRDALAERLNSKGIPTRVYYPVPLHLQEAYKDMGYQKGRFPNAEKCSESVLSLPLFPELKESEIQFIAESIQDIVGE